MRVYRNKKEIKEVLKTSQPKKRSVGLVPTMGALHLGHLSLVKRALVENEIVVVSIFVNPTQFDNAEDLEKYPSNFQADLELLASVSEHIIVFAPSKIDIYDGNVRSQSYNFKGLEKVMEGKFRTGHFDGVATIVQLLFQAVGPNRAYFGEKDFQQLQIIKKLVEQSNLEVEVVPCPIEREPNGLALSSRNERLSKATRLAAGFIHKTLQSAKIKFGTENAKDIKEWVSMQFHQNQMFELEYFEISDVETLSPIIEKQITNKYRAFIAVYAEGIRLIDNIALN